MTNKMQQKKTLTKKRKQTNTIIYIINTTHTQFKSNFVSIQLTAYVVLSTSTTQFPQNKILLYANFGISFSLTFMWCATIVNKIS